MGIAHLTDARAKLARAYEHFKALEDEIDEFERQEEAKVGTVTDRRDGPWHVLYLDPVPRLTMHMALVAGDCLNNIRAALDHLVYQLVLREDKEPKQANCFPIFTDPDEFKERCVVPAGRNRDKHPLGGISLNGPAWAMIQRAQPFNRPKKDDDELAVINKFTNVDKHRTLLVQRAFTDREVLASRIRWNAGVQPVEQLFSSLPLSLEQPTEIARFRFAPDVVIGSIHSAMNMDGELPLRPCVGDGKIYIPLMQLDIGIRRVSAILDEFAALPGVQETALQTKLFTA